MERRDVYPQHQNPEVPLVEGCQEMLQRIRLPHVQKSTQEQVVLRQNERGYEVIVLCQVQHLFA